MRVLFVTSEATPFAKTGGLGDVCGSLPRALRRHGVEADVVLPLYGTIDPARFPSAPEGAPFPVPLGHRGETATVERSDAGGGVAAFLVRNERYFGREHLYGTRDGDYVDNCERFAFLCRAVMEWVGRSGGRYDVLHANDWQAALVCVYLRTLYRDHPSFAGTASVFTVHNLGYQGIFWNHDLPLTGLGWEHFTPQGLEYYGNLNLMKAGLNYGDLLTTVSPTYAREIQTAEYGYGLEGVLHERRGDLSGILNGVDYGEWSPATDALLPATYSAADLSGKRECREALLREFGLSPGEEPVAGLVSRLASQKGIDLVEQAGDALASRPLRLAILGSGERRYEDSLSALAARHPGRVSLRLAYDERVAHLVEAGSDLYLMPSRYEPCGLNQIYSLRYGTPPVARATGGIADTVSDADADPAGGTGFLFRGFDGGEFLDAVDRALRAFSDRERWRSIQARGMGKEFSWDGSAREYAALYGRALEKVAARR